MYLYVTKNVENKIKEFHNVEVIEAEEAFANFNGRMLQDDRLQHKTKPPTYWFLSTTFDGRLLKLVVKIDFAFLKTAYKPSEEEIIYYEEKT